MQKSTKTTQKTKLAQPKFKSTNWFHAHQSVKLRLSPEAQSNDGFTSRLWLATREYYSPIDLIFLCQSFNPLRMNHRPLWLARDGLVPLLWFFKQNPEPREFMQHLLVHEDFAQFVPPNWRPVTGTYRVENTARALGAEPQRLLLTSVVSSAFCSLEHLKLALTELEERYGTEKLHQMEKICYLPTEFFGNTKQDFHAEFMFEICRRLGTQNLKSLGNLNLEVMTSFEGTEVIELNERFLTPDNYVVQSILQRGGRLPEAQNARKGGAFASLSPFHGFRIHEDLHVPYALETEGAAEGFFSKFDEIMHSQANLAFPWPTWVKNWAKSLAEKQKLASKLGKQSPADV